MAVALGPGVGICSFATAVAIGPGEGIHFFATKVASGPGVGTCIPNHMWEFALCQYSKELICHSA